MPNLAKLLKEEIQRLARKEIKSSLNQLRRDTISQKRAMAQQKRHMAEMERALRRLGSSVSKGVSPAASMDDAMEDGARITAKVVVRMRKRLGLSQAALAEVLGLNTQTVYQWEHKKGQLQFRGDTRQRLLELRGLGKREAQQRLAGARRARKARPARKTRGRRRRR